ncbi:hypothetical protein BDP27DRAFT_1330573 [Rhodocollybia butyracea]|uniref:Uncharacterized protein n=1 Tax=Rhodocollybia butyracea TaxID=206335 RepID=A0A9P5PR51_9AGAR|nr:hypothetical protein BDP27DRAFT_1330573 [Rhodocollybia butyracea]
MLQIPSMLQMKEWYEMNPKIACKLCLQQQRPHCVPKVQYFDYTSCSFCADNATVCTWRVNELRYRVKKNLSIDDPTFNILEQQTKQLRSWYLQAATASSTTPTPIQIPTGPSLSAEQFQLRKVQHLLIEPTTAKIDLHTKVKETPALRVKPQKTATEQDPQTDADEPVVMRAGTQTSDNDAAALRAELEETRQSSDIKVRELEKRLKKAHEAAGAAEVQLAKQVEELKRELLDIKTEKDALSGRAQVLEDIHTSIVQKELIEHANIHVLIRFLSHARDDFASDLLTREQMLQTCDNLGEQLREVAARRLERAPLGFSPIEAVMCSRTRRTWDEAFNEDNVSGDDSPIFKDGNGNPRAQSGKPVPH